MDTNTDHSSNTYHDEATQLMQKIAENDVDAFERLYDKYGSFLEHILACYDNHNMLSEDFIQEVFTRLWQHRMNFRGQSRFTTYLHSIARYTAIEEIRRSQNKAKRELNAHLDINKNICDGLSQPESELFLKELTRILEKGRAGLTINERHAMDAFQNSDVSLRAISQKVGCSHDALRTRLKRARERLKELLVPIIEGE